MPSVSIQAALKDREPALNLTERLKNESIKTFENVTKNNNKRTTLKGTGKKSLLTMFRGLTHVEKNLTFTSFFGVNWYKLLC